MPTGTPKNGINKGWIKKGEIRGSGMLGKRGLPNGAGWNRGLKLDKIKYSHCGFQKGNTLAKGENNIRWIKDRTKLCRVSKQGERRTSAYFEWRKQVWLRDNWKCKIANPDCK